MPSGVMALGGPSPKTYSRGACPGSRPAMTMCLPSPDHRQVSEERPVEPGELALPVLAGRKCAQHQADALVRQEDAPLSVDVQQPQRTRHAQDRALPARERDCAKRLPL